MRPGPSISPPLARVRALVDAPTRPDGDYVLYWMAAARRSRHNFALERAVAWAREMGRPLLIFEGLRAAYPWASRRFHAFVLDGMVDNAAAVACGAAGATYLPYVEPSAGAGRGLLVALAHRACVVVSDDYPCFFLPRAQAALARQVADRRFELVDGNGIYPMRATDRVFTTAHSFRAHLQKELPTHLERFPAADPLAGPPLPRLRGLPPEIPGRWPSLEASRASLERVAGLRGPAETAERGGPRAGAERLDAFIEGRLGRYDSERNTPEDGAASGLSPYLHFGHVGAHTVFEAVMTREGWDPGRIGEVRGGSRSGYWGVGSAAESFLDELVTWRELGFNRCALTEDYTRFESLPAWARATLADHADDPRPWLYDLEQFARAETHDPLWNAAQRELASTGRMHNYLRMLWGKKILEWSPSPRDALAVMVELNNRYALDGRDPNSYSGIFWVLGRYDRAWGPERPVFGKVRYMSSDNTRRKIRLDAYLARFGADDPGARGRAATQGVLFE